MRTARSHSPRVYVLVDEAGEILSAHRTLAAAESACLDEPGYCKVNRYRFYWSARFHGSIYKNAEAIRADRRRRLIRTERESNSDPNE